MMKLIAKILRKIYRVFHPNPVYNHITIPDEEVSNYLIHQIESNRPFCVARFGNGEFLSMQYGYLRHESLWKRFKSYIQGFNISYEPHKEIGEGALNTISFFSGFFPRDIQLLDKFYRLMLDSLKDVDLLGVVPWNKEDLFAEYYSDQIEYCGYDRFEPYDYVEPWTKALEGKRVLVVHPFAKTIEAQYARRELLWANKEVLPNFDLITMKAVQSLCDEDTEFNTWFDALTYMEQRIEEIDFDIAIIGCGAYSFPLAVYCKRKGKQAIQLAGATQILFGIKGKRWDENPAVNKFYNEYWVRPLPEETPKQSTKVENGCYW